MCRDLPACPAPDRFKASEEIGVLLQGRHNGESKYSVDLIDRVARNPAIGLSVLIDELPPEGEARMPFLIRNRRFLECMVFVWQSVENYVDQMIIQEFELFF
jgi:hypothetical protein